MFLLKTSRRQVIQEAARPVIESLEQRRLLSVNVSTNPIVLEFDRPRGGLTDQAARGTGFNVVQGNSFGDEYQPNQLVLRPGASVLTVRTVGNATNGGNYEGDNSLVNGLQSIFDARLGQFTVSTIIRRPGESMDATHEQAGILFGPTQDNYIKLVVGWGTGGPQVQFLDEQLITGSNFIHQLGRSGVIQSLGSSFDGIEQIELRLAGDPSTGKFAAFYRVNNGSLVKINTELTLTGSQKDSFFRRTARAGIMAMHKNGDGGISVAFDRFSIEGGPQAGAQPTVSAVRPGAGETGVARDAFVAVDVNLPTVGAGVDASTLTSGNVRLYRTSDGVQVPSVVNTTGGGDAIVLQPTVLLDANTNYTFEISNGVKDTSGAAFQAFTSTFTTGTQGVGEDSQVAFEKIELGSAQFRSFTGVDVGPDGRLYASTLNGQLLRWRIRPDGTIADREIVNTVRNRNGGDRLITGFAFDPRSTADSVILWVNHGDPDIETAANWTGKISKVWGSRMERYADAVVGLPRSIRDHLTNQPRFGADGGLYFPQGAQSAMGAPDNAWGRRPEELLSAAILRLDIARAEQHMNDTGAAVNVRTDSTGGYNPFQSTAPLRIWASGVRNAYDLLFHSNGRLYSATNGSAANGATPATPNPNPFASNRIDGSPYTGPSIPAISKVNQTQPDLLFDIQPGGYYGHPNPTRSEFVMNGGNPTSGVDALQVSQYPVGTQPDRNFRGAAYNFGLNYSPNGMAEYTYADSFGGALAGKILVTRYSGGDDILVLNPRADGTISGSQSGIAGFTGFVDPLDLAVDPRRGNIYVAEFGANKITLLRPVVPGAKADVDTTTLRFVEPRGGNPSPAKSVTIRNTGTSALALPSDGLTITGADASLFNLVGAPGLPTTIAAGESLTLNINFNPGGTVGLTIRTAQLRIKTNDPSNPLIIVNLRGLPTTGTGGMNEPSLQRVFDLYELPIRTGDSTPNETVLTIPNGAVTDELDIQRFVKAGGGPVTIAPIAAFAVSQNPAVRVGFYSPGTPAESDELFTINGIEAQSIDPFAQGSVKFDPGTSPFGIYGTFPGFTNSDGTNRRVFTENTLNTWESVVANRNKVRVYPLIDSNGNAVANSYVMAFEEFTSAYDYQDVVLVIRNVRPADAGPEMGISNADMFPFADRLVMSRIQNPLISDPTITTSSKTTAVLRVTNTGTSNLVVSSMSTTGPFSVTNSGGFTVAPGATQNVTVTFTQASGNSRVLTGNLTINSNDADEPVKTITLVGWFQSHPEIAPNKSITEPNLPTIAQMFGISTDVGTPGQLNGGGQVKAVGEEILSPYFVAADPGQQINVLQLVGYRQSGTVSVLRWFEKGKPNNLNTVIVNRADDAQTVLPRRNNSTLPAFGNFKTTATFGLKTDNEFSDPTLNPQEKPGGGYGHRFRVYPARDANGQYIPDTYLVAMDYNAINYDYQDNVYLISNIRPANIPPTPAGFSGLATGNGVLLTWAGVQTEGIAGYNIYRSSSFNGTFSKVNSSLQLVTEFLDQTAVSGNTYFYRLTAVTTGGVESVPHSVIANA